MINEWTGVNKLFKNRFITSNYGNIISKTRMHFLDKCYIADYRNYAGETINSFQDFAGHVHVSPQDIYIDILELKDSDDHGAVMVVIVL